MLEWFAVQSPVQCRRFFRGAVERGPRFAKVAGSDLIYSFQLQSRITRRIEYEFRESFAQQRLLALPLGGDVLAIDARADVGLRVLLADDVELLLGAIPFARKTEQFEKKGAMRQVGRVGLDPACYFFDGRLKPAGLKQFFCGSHNNSCPSSAPI